MGTVGRWRTSRPIEEIDGEQLLWNNRGVWWLAVTLICDETNQKHRLRVSLRTRNLETAKRRRKKALEKIQECKIKTTV